MEEEITFEWLARFTGSAEQFEGLVTGINKLRESGVMIDTVPLPEKHLTVIKPWPYPGGWPIESVLSKRFLEKITDGMVRIKLDGIEGGMRNAHLHIGNEAVLLDKARFKQAVGQAAKVLGERLAETANYYETIGAIRGLVPRER